MLKCCSGGGFLAFSTFVSFFFLPLDYVASGCIFACVVDFLILLVYFHLIC
jgi:hypothetical protein